MIVAQQVLLLHSRRIYDEKPEPERPVPVELLLPSLHFNLHFNFLRRNYVSRTWTIFCRSTGSIHQRYVLFIRRKAHYIESFRSESAPSRLVKRPEGTQIHTHTHPQSTFGCRPFNCECMLRWCVMCVALTEWVCSGTLFSRLPVNSTANKLHLNWFNHFQFMKSLFCQHQEHHTMNGERARDVHSAHIACQTVYDVRPGSIGKLIFLPHVISSDSCNWTISFFCISAVSLLGWTWRVETTCVSIK